MATTAAGTRFDEIEVVGEPGRVYSIAGDDDTLPLRFRRLTGADGKYSGIDVR